MPREYYWQKTAVCELGCAFYAVRKDGSEACTLVGYRLHPDWCDIALECDDFKTPAQVERERKEKEEREKAERKERSKAKKQ